MLNLPDSCLSSAPTAWLPLSPNAPQIIALSVGANRLDADNFKGTSPCTEVVVSNQASKLAAATGGIYKSGIDINTIVQVGQYGYVSNYWNCMCVVYFYLQQAFICMHLLDYDFVA